MPCYHPLKAWRVGFTANNKDKLLITGYDVDHLEWSTPDNKWLKIKDPISENVYRDVMDKYIEIPCGHCLGCRLDHSRDWANRCLLEMQDHESNMFITLTYDDIHVPLSSCMDTDTGELIDTLTLRKRDFQLFMKRLRKKYAVNHDNKLRFFMCGEYGDKTFRPHYHAIVFGLELPDMKPYKRQGDFWYYTSEWLQDLWPYGYVVAAPASWETAAYTARYVVKKAYGMESDVYESLGIEKEFTLMSRMPGIGLKWLEEKKGYDNFLEDVYIYQGTPDGSKKFLPPKYFKRKFDDWFEDSDSVYYYQYKFDRVQKNQKYMESIKKLQLSQTDLGYLDMLAAQEVNLSSKLKGLERSL